jgi:hypothetical protein
MTTASQGTEQSDQDDRRSTHVRLAGTHRRCPRLREVEVTEQVTQVRTAMASGYEHLAVQYLEMASAVTGDPSQAQLNAYIGSGYSTLALLEELRQS